MTNIRKMLLVLSLAIAGALFIPVATTAANADVGVGVHIGGVGAGVHLGGHHHRHCHWRHHHRYCR